MRPVSLWPFYYYGCQLFNNLFYFKVNANTTYSTIMFMFVFSVITISIVGLFFQIVSALTAYFLSQQVGLGEQMLKWHSMAYSYSCGAGSSKSALTNDTIVQSEVPRATEIAGTYPWKSVLFSGTYNGTAVSRMLVTYVLPTERPSGFSHNDVARQLTRVTMRQFYRFGRVTGGTIGFTSYDAGVPATISIGGLPGAVVDSSVALVSTAVCN
jgi:hypothetical protein